MSKDNPSLASFCFLLLSDPLAILLLSDPLAIFLLSDPLAIFLQSDPLVILLLSDPFVIFFLSDPFANLLLSNPCAIFLLLGAFTVRGLDFQNKLQESSHQSHDTGVTFWQTDWAQERIPDNPN